MPVPTSVLCWHWRLVVLNYLGRADGAPLARRLVSYRELDGGQLFYPAFARASVAPLAGLITRRPAEGIRAACRRLGECIEDTADVCAVFHLLPRFPVRVRIWAGDEELGASANILFDAGANHYLHTEEIAAAGDIVAGFLVRQCELTA